MGDPNNISQETLDFVKLFEPSLKEQIIPWSGDDAVGLSVLRNYPKDSKFRPAKNKKGEDDSVVLVKIGYLKDKQGGDVKKLFVTASKASRFLLKGNLDFIFNKDNEESPTEASLDESKKSK